MRNIERIGKGTSETWSEREGEGAERGNERERERVRGKKSELEKQRTGG